MQYQVFVQNPAKQRFVASVVGMPAVSAEAATEEEAHASTFPMRYAGIFADDPTFEDWVEKLQLIRQQANSQEG